MLTRTELRERRQALGASREELGRVAGLSGETIRSLESGVRTGRADTWARAEAGLMALVAARARRIEEVYGLKEAG